jgi:uncharacterized membrane protein
VVSSTRTASRLMIIARPNQSASWRANLLLLFALSLPVLAIAVIFALLGAWLILPFAGAEMLALGAGLHYANRKQQFQQVITVSEDSVCIDQGRRTPSERWEFSRQNSGLTITNEQHPWDGPALCVHDRNDRVTLGDFLNREDSLELMALLQSEFHVRARSKRSTSEF